MWDSPQSGWNYTPIYSVLDKRIVRLPNNWVFWVEQDVLGIMLSSAQEKVMHWVDNMTPDIVKICQFHQ